MDDLDQFWADIFSADAEAIAAAWASIGADERAAVIELLRKITADPGRHPSQRRAAEAALEVVEAASEFSPPRGDGV